MKNKVEINRDKSGVLELRQDQRTPRCLPSTYENAISDGPPLLSEYEYLGVLVDDDIKFKSNTKRKRD